MKTTMFFLALTLGFLTSNLSAQIISVRSTEQAVTDNNLKTKFVNESAYFTFDFTKKLVTLKTISESGSSSHIYTFKILKMYSEQTILGETTNLIVSSSNFPLATRIYYSDLHGGAIWIDTNAYTITYKGLIIIQ